jgi:hypothetical protein
MSDLSQNQPLYLVLGGELTNLDGSVFRNPENTDVVGVYSDYANACAAWKSKAQGSVDNAHMRYFVLDISASFKRPVQD